MLPSRIDSQEVVENLERVLSNKKLEKEVHEIEGGVKGGGKTVFKLSDHKGVRYLLNNEYNLLVISTPGFDTTESGKMKEIVVHELEGLEVYQATADGYKLVVMNHSDKVQTVLLFNPDGELIAEMLSYRPHKNYVVGLEKEGDVVRIYAVSESEAKDKYYYKFEIDTKQEPNQVLWYNLSAL